MNHEAFIGIIYALGISASVLLLSKSPHGTEEIQKLIAADILFVSFRDVVKIALIYAALGIFIFLVVESGE